MTGHDEHPAPHPSRSAEAAAVGWGDTRPGEDIVEHVPPASPAEPDTGVPNRHSAAAEARVAASGRARRRRLTSP